MPKIPRFGNGPAPGRQNYRFYCAECHERLKVGGKPIFIQHLPGSPDVPLLQQDPFFQDPYKPCSNHPEAGFYIIFKKP